MKRMNLEEYLCREEGFSPVEAGGIIMAGKVLVNDQVCQQKHYAPAGRGPGAGEI